MARDKFSIDFDGFLDLARQISEVDENLLIKATENALRESKDFVNKEIEKAMNASKYHFDNTGYSKGKAKKSLHETMKKPIEWNGTQARAYIGADLKEAKEAIILAYGTPHLTGDKKLLNATKVKGNVRKEVDRIQAEEFNKVMREALNG